MAQLRAPPSQWDRRGAGGSNPPVGPMKASGVARPRRCDPRVLRPCLFGLASVPDAVCWIGPGKAHVAWCKGSPMAPGLVRLRLVQRDRVRRLMRVAPVV